MKYDFTHFTDELSKIKCTLNNSQLEQFELYYDMLIEKNKVMNLTAITDFDEVIEKHFLDSLFLCHIKGKAAANIFTQAFYQTTLILISRPLSRTWTRMYQL